MICSQAISIGNHMISMQFVRKWHQYAGNPLEATLHERNHSLSFDETKASRPKDPDKLTVSYSP